MTFCCLCDAHGIERRAAPVKEGVPLCDECRTASADRIAAGSAEFATGSDNPLVRYATRLVMAGGLATMTTRGTA